MFILSIAEVLRASIVLIAIWVLVSLITACQQVSFPSIRLLSDHLLLCVDSVAPVTYHTACAHKLTLSFWSPS